MSKRPLTHWVIQGSVNNEIRITRRSSSPSPRKGGDKAEQKRLEAESKRLNQIIEISRALGRYQGQTFIEVPILPWKSRVGILKPLEISKSPTGVDLGKYRRSDIEAFRDRLMEEDRVLRGNSPSPLDIPNEFAENLNQVTKPLSTRDLKLGFLRIRDRKKSDRLTRSGRHKILEAGQVIENHCQKNAVFVTTTIPGSTPDAIRTVAENIHTLIKNLMNMIRDFGKKRGIKLYSFYSLELQGRGALHPHVVVAGKPSEISPEDLLAFGNKLKDHWFKMLLKLEKKTGVDVFARNSRYGVSTWKYSPDEWQHWVEMAKHSVAAYISKYASKEATDKHEKALDNLAAMGIELALPKRWWGSSQNVKDEAKKLHFKFTFPMAWMDDPEIMDLIYSIIQGKYLENTGYVNCVDLPNPLPENGCMTVHDNILERSLGYRWDVSRNNRSVIHGETEIYWYNPAIFTEIHGQFKALLESEFIAIPSEKFSSPKRVTSTSVLSRVIDSQHQRMTEQEIKITGVEPGTGMIVDFEQFLCHQDWQNMQDPWWKVETFRLADEEIEWSAKVWSIWFNQLRDMNRQNEYDYQFGNHSPIREIGEWQMIEALSSSWELEKKYRDGLIS